MGLAELARRAKLKVSKTPSAIVAIDDSLNKGYGAISFDVLRQKADKFIEALEKSSDGDHDRTEFFVALADLFFSATLTYDGSGKTFLHPSSFMEECERKLFYDLTDTPYSNPSPPHGAQLQRIFDFGTILHVYIQYHLWRAGVLTEAEAAAVRVERRVHGKADGILVFERGGEKIMLEIKTANEFSYHKAKREPFMKHKRQATVYANILKITKVLFVYINKNTSEMAEHLYEVDKNITSETEYVMRSVVESTESNNPPHQSCKNAFTKNALACPYRDHCFNLTQDTHEKTKTRDSAPKGRTAARRRRKRVDEPSRESERALPRSRVRRRK